MRKYANYGGAEDSEDLYVCRQCDALGKSPFVESSDVDEDEFNDDWTSEDEYRHRQVETHGSLTVGMRVKNGVVQEIYPGLDKFTVCVKEGTWCSIMHCKISEFKE